MADRKVRDYVEHEVVAQLRRKQDLQIIGKQIQENTDSHAKGDVGIRARGKIDFLVNYCGYSHMFVKGFK
jgi:hypothetical protein